MFSVIINTCTCMFKGNYQKVIDILSLLGLCRNFTNLCED